MASRSHYIRTRAAFTLFLILLLTSHATENSAKEKQKCAEQLEGASTCLPYVMEDAKAPTPDCCNGLKDAVKNSIRCLCLMGIYRNDPDLGFKLNTTLALGLPYICKAPLNLSQCPALLHLDPNSPEAQIFNQVNRNFTSTNSTSGDPPVEGSPVGVRNGTPAAENEARYNRKRMSMPATLVTGILIWLTGILIWLS